ncbi:MAG: GGDEF domain-containing protein, partial [Planctomycetales bacterium]|nr:GGDEF domain-containing protein [Planctomycetales bacterium]
FKSINDNFGHSVGDEVLIKVAAALQEAARETDYVCRYGGEEFCVILPHVGIDGAQIAAERFRACIADLEFSQLQVTASLGCSDATFGAPSAESLIDQSDQALYCAKENGRNRVVRFDRIVEVEMNDSAQQESQASAVRSGKPMPTSIPPTKSISNATVDKLFAADL